MAQNNGPESITLPVKPFTPPINRSLLQLRQRKRQNNVSRIHFFAITSGEESINVKVQLV